MFPVLFHLGPLTLHTYGLFVALGVLLGTQWAIALAVREGWPSRKANDLFYALVFYVVIGGLAGGRLFYVLIYSQEFASNPISALMFWQGGLVSYGGLAGAMLGFWLWKRREPDAPWKNVLDNMAPPLAVGHALGRLGCFFAGCCYGRPTDKPWGVIFTNPLSLAPLDIALHPTQIYESAYLLVLGIFLFYRKISRANAVAGSLFADYLALYSAGRFAIEFFRADNPFYAGLTSGQWMSAAVFAASFILRSRLAAHPESSSR